MPPRFLTRTVYLIELAVVSLLFFLYGPDLFGNPAALRGWTVVVWCFAAWWMRLEPNPISRLFHIIAVCAACGLGLYMLFGDLQPLTDSSVRREVLNAPESFGMTAARAILFLAPAFVALVFLLSDGDHFKRASGRGR